MHTLQASAMYFTKLFDTATAFSPGMPLRITHLIKRAFRSVHKVQQYFYIYFECFYFVQSEFLDVVLATYSSCLSFSVLYLTKKSLRLWTLQLFSGSFYTFVEPDFKEHGGDMQAKNIFFKFLLLIYCRFHLRIQK